MAKSAAKRAVTRRVTTVTDEVAPESDTEISVPAERQTEQRSDYEALEKLKELGGGEGTRWEVRRTSPYDKVGYCCTYGTEELTLERIRDEWGIGSYSIRGRLADGTFLPSENIKIADGPKLRDATQHTAPVAQQNDVGALIAAIQSGSQAQISMLTELVKGLIARPEPARETINPLDILKTVKEIVRDERPKSDGSESVKLLLQGLELGRKISGGEGASDWLDIADKGLTMLPKLFGRDSPTDGQAGSSPAPVASQGDPAGSGKRGLTVHERQPIAEGGNVNVIKKIQWVTRQSQMLVIQAARNKDPELYAEVFLDNLPTFITIVEIAEQFRREDAMQELAKLNGDVAKYPEWFERFRREVVQFLDAQREPPTDDLSHDGNDDSAGIE